MSMKKAWLLAVTGFSLAVGGSLLIAAEDAPKKTDAAAKAKKETKDSKAAKDTDKDKDDDKDKEEDKDAEEKPKKDPFAVPADASPEELIKFVKNLLNPQMRFTSQQQVNDYIKKIIPPAIEATDKVLAAKDVEEELAEQALEMQFMTLMIKSRVNAKDAAKQELELAKKYSTDPRAKLATIAKDKMLIARLKNLKELKADEQDKLVDEALASLQQAIKAVGPGKKADKDEDKDDADEPKEKTAAERAAERKRVEGMQKVQQMAMMIGSTLEESDNEKLAASTYDRIADLLSKSGEPNFEKGAKTYSGLANRLRMIGHPLEIEGELVTGNPIDWASYKGKVVLVDFWATWCGPCVGEFPNVKRNYLGYHAKGFDIVGVSLDQNKDALEEFIADRHVPWANLFSSDKKATGWAHPLATKYGVNSIPFTVLVGKDGNVVKLNVRGEALGEILKDLLGEPDEQAIKAAEAAEEKLEAEKKTKEEKEDKDAKKKEDKKDKDE